MHIVGVDVGYSKTRKSTGVACLNGDSLTLYKADMSWQDRRRNIPQDFSAEWIAIDGPLLPLDANASIKRCCESVFSRGSFQRRCKPGMSHFGNGLLLRQAAAECCIQFSQLLAPKNGPEAKGRVRPKGPIIEAFPNAFLAVLLEEREFPSAPKLPRGKKFDWLYDQVAANGILRQRLSKVLILPPTAWDQIEQEKDHDKRAALICLLTAALARTRHATPVGNASTGWFWLPLKDYWATWAARSLEIVLHTADCKIDGH